LSDGSIGHAKPRQSCRKPFWGSGFC